MNEISQNLIRAREQIAQAARLVGRDPAVITLLAVSKTFGADCVVAAIDSGQASFGENYVQEAVGKIREIRSLRPNRGDLRFHFIGRLQRNKARDVVGTFSLIQSVDRAELGAAIAEAADRAGIVQDVLMQVNVSDEPQKGGVSVDGAQALAESLLRAPQLQLRGLMTIGRLDHTDGAVLRAEFRTLRELRDRLSLQLSVPLPELSMGMSGDFETAIEEGATIVRIGSAIFGSRPVKQ